MLAPRGFGRREWGRGSPLPRATGPGKLGVVKHVCGSDGMNPDLEAATVSPRHLGKSIGAVVAGFLCVVVLSLGTDQVMHLLGIYPPWGVPMRSHGLCLLALSYRMVWTVVGGYVTARLAPRNSMRHVAVLAGIGFVLGAIGAIAAIPMDLGPAWYPIAVAITGPICTWFGGVLHARKTAVR